MINLGIIGMSEGNGHPYSWSAIFNGYNSEYMNTCIFPIIPEYLSKQSFPEDSIKNAAVTSIFSQDKKISQHIAKSSNIDNVAGSLEELIETSDAILLARDDAENHYKFAKPIIESGLPVYIDKPVALDLQGVERIYDLEQYKNQIFTCSAIAYAHDLKLSSEDFESIGKILHIDACIANSWDKYAIHIIEPVLNIIGHEFDIISKSTIKVNTMSALHLELSNGISVNIKTMGKMLSPINLRVFGEKGFKELTFSSSVFYSFRAALQHFIDIIENKKSAHSREFVFKAVEIVAAGRQ